MAESSSLHKSPENQNDATLDLENNLNTMIEEAETMLVNLAWMTYDMVALRTNPELEASMRGLKEAFLRCRAAVCGDRIQEEEEAAVVEEVEEGPDPVN